jgi:hypothetical protein
MSDGKSLGEPVSRQAQAAHELVVVQAAPAGQHLLAGLVKDVGHVASLMGLLPGPRHAGATAVQAGHQLVAVAAVAGLGPLDRRARLVEGLA